MRNYILIVGRPKSGKLRVVKALVNSLPENIPKDSHAGLKHELLIRNQYYNADVNVWVDELESNMDGIRKWVEEFSGETAQQVRDVLGAVVHTIDPTVLTPDELSQEIKAVAEFTSLLETELDNGDGNLDGTSTEILKLVVSHGSLPKEAHLKEYMDERFIEHIDLNQSTSKPPRMDEFETRRGIDRLKEVIEAYEWVEFPDNNPDEQDITNENNDPATALLEDHVEDYEKLVKTVTEGKKNAANMNEDDKKKLYDEISQLVERLV